MIGWIRGYRLFFHPLGRPISDVSNRERVRRVGSPKGEGGNSARERDVTCDVPRGLSRRVREEEEREEKDEVEEAEEEERTGRGENFSRGGRESERAGFLGGNKRDG